MSGEDKELDLDAIKARLAANHESWVPGHERFMFVIDSAQMRALLARVAELEAEAARLRPYVDAFRREEKRADGAERDRDDARAAVEEARGHLKAITAMHDKGPEHSGGVVARAFETSRRMAGALAALSGAKPAEAPACPCGGNGCRGVADNERHQCGGPGEACVIPGCRECGAAVPAAGIETPKAMALNLWPGEPGTKSEQKETDVFRGVALAAIRADRAAIRKALLAEADTYGRGLAIPRVLREFAAKLGKDGAQ